MSDNKMFDSVTKSTCFSQSFSYYISKSHLHAIKSINYVKILLNLLYLRTASCQTSSACQTLISEMNQFKEIHIAFSKFIPVWGVKKIQLSYTIYNIYKKFNRLNRQRTHCL